MVRVLRLPGLAPLQAPQSARREDEGEHRSYAERVKRPDEQEGSAGLGDLAAKNASRSHHVRPVHCIFLQIRRHCTRAKGLSHVVIGPC